MLLVRGGAVIVASTADGEVRLDGSSVSTWHERRVGGVTSIVLGDAVAPEAGLPLLRGVVPADGALVSRDGVRTADGPAPVATPVAVPIAPPSVPVQAQAPVPSMPAPAPIIEATITELAEPEVGGAVPTAADSAAAENTLYAHLFEETIVRSIEDAAVRPPTEDEDAAVEVDDVVPDAAEPATGDHDGMTIMSGDLAKLRARGHAVGASEASAPPAPPRFVLAVSNGTTEEVTGTVLFGRSPSVAKVSSGQVPRLVSITGDQDISRNHAQFALEGDTVVVTDLHSRNGTSIVLPGHAPQILRPGEPTPIIVGTVVDLGGGTTMTLGEEA